MSFRTTLNPSKCCCCWCADYLATHSSLKGSSHRCLHTWSSTFFTASVHDLIPIIFIFLTTNLCHVSSDLPGLRYPCSAQLRLIACNYLGVKNVVSGKLVKSFGFIISGENLLPDQDNVELCPPKNTLEQLTHKCCTFVGEKVFREMMPVLWVFKAILPWYNSILD